MVMVVPPATPRDAEWVLARPLRQPDARGTPATLHHSANANPSSPPMICRRSPASSSFVLAAARLRALQQDPLPHGDVNRAAARRLPNNSQAQPGHNDARHRVKPLRPLDNNGPHGCRRQRVPGRAGSGVQGESSRAIDRTSAPRRPPCQSCGDKGDGRHTALRGLEGITVSEGDGRGERARSRRSGRPGR